jgi:hypothetical protein
MRHSTDTLFMLHHKAPGYIFMLGSTTIVILDDAARQNLNPREVLTPSTVVMGQNLSQ